MKKAGQLVIKNNVPQVDGMALAVYVAADLFQGASDLLQSIGINAGEGIWVKGTRGQVGSQTVLFMSQVSKFFLTAAGSLGGDPQPAPLDFQCKQCSFLNAGLPYVDVNHPPICKNPAPPPHNLKVL
ncbi:MAG TPA: hypothetical protein VJP89_11265 [Pyrinomonadaceae bacterium]|nr:hypothetical protein [Pyrinomonadaceae bacterium]